MGQPLGMTRSVFLVDLALSSCGVGQNVLKILFSSFVCDLRLLHGFCWLKT